MLDSWNDDHPFVSKFIEQQRDDGGVVLRLAFQKTIDCYDSERTPEVRLADVIAAVVRRADGGEHLRGYDYFEISRCRASGTTCLSGYRRHGRARGVRA